MDKKNNMVIEKQDGEKIEVENIIGIAVNSIMVEEEGVKPYLVSSVFINIPDKKMPVLLGKYSSTERANEVKELLYDDFNNNDIEEFTMPKE